MNRPGMAMLINVVVSTFFTLVPLLVLVCINFPYTTINYNNGTIIA